MKGEGSGGDSMLNQVAGADIAVHQRAFSPDPGFFVAIVVVNIVVRFPELELEPEPEPKAF